MTTWTGVALMDENGRLTLGSLFSGSGAFELGGLIAGIRPVWASEIEPFPIRVTTRRLPFVKHYGDVNSIRGDEVEPVDIITFGSPCQNLSQSLWHLMPKWLFPSVASVERPAALSSRPCARVMLAGMPWACCCSTAIALNVSI